MTQVFVWFSDATEAKIIGEFASPQDEADYPNLGVVEDDDPRYLAFINPPPNVLVIQSAKLVVLKQLAEAQKTALTSRIGTLNDAIELEMATPEEEIELPKRVLQLKAWKTYAILLGRVTAQVGWPPEVNWPVQPLDGMDLTVSATAPQTV